VALEVARAHSRHLKVALEVACAPSRHETAMLDYKEQGGDSKEGLSCSGIGHYTGDCPRKCTPILAPPHPRHRQCLAGRPAEIFYYFISRVVSFFSFSHFKR
jgi:hypothetical protein